MAVNEDEMQQYRNTAFQHKNQLYHLAISLLGNSDEAEDAVQDVFIKAAQRHDQFEGRSGIYTWLVRILINHCHDVRRKKKRQKTHSLESRNSDNQDVTLDVADNRQNLQEKVELSEASGRLMTMLGKLDDIYKEVVLLRYFEEMSYAVIAETLEISEGTVKSRLNNARRILRSELQTLGIGEEYLAAQ